MKTETKRKSEIICPIQISPKSPIAVAAASLAAATAAAAVAAAPCTGFLGRMLCPHQKAALEQYGFEGPHGG